VRKIVAVHYDEDIFIDGHFQSKYYDKANQIHGADLVAGML